MTRKNTAEIDEQRRAGAWESVAFCNYVPVVAAHYSRERPGREMFVRGAQRFREVLDRLEPGAVAVFGFQTWGWMMHGMAVPGKHWDEPATPFAQVDRAIAARICHPSRGFSYERWRPVFHELLERAKAVSGHDVP